MSKKPNKYTGIKPLVMASDAEGNIDEDSLTNAIEKSGLSREVLQQIHDYGMDLRRLAMERGLDPPQVLSAALNISSEIVSDCFPRNMHAQICLDIYQQLLSVCDITDADADVSNHVMHGDISQVGNNKYKES
jgi:hypothetical protein